MGRPAIVTPATGLVAGILTGIVGVAALAGLGWPDGAEPTSEPPQESASAAAAFLEAWRRSRLATWVIDARFERLLSDGRTLAEDVHMAQRPPDRLTVGLGTVDARRGARRLACTADTTGQLVCRDGGPAPPYEAEVDAELQLLEGYVAPRGLYAVAAEPGPCFRLHLRRTILTPPYGRRARFCFDPETAAPVRTEVERAGSRDLTLAVRVSAEPTDAELDPGGVRDGGGRG